MKEKIYISVLTAITVLIMSSLNFAQWIQRENIPTARYFTASCELQGKIYVIGGGTSFTTSMNTMEVYDPAADSWDVTRKAMPTPRVELCAAAINGKIYAIGGAVSHAGAPVGTVEVYDPVTDTWDTSKMPMITPRKGAAAGVINNKIYIAGGSGYSDFSPSDQLEIYDPVMNTWSPGSNMLQGLYEPEGAVVNGIFYVIGGLLGSPWEGQTTVQKYDPVNDTWTPADYLDTGRVGHTASAANGKIYVIGGDRQPPRIKNVAEYQPNTNTWAWFDDIPDYMISHSASVLDNVIYVFSGSTTSMPYFTLTSAVYSFDPAAVDVKSQINDIPEHFLLYQNYPNPFNPATKIIYSVPQTAQVQIKVFDVLGNEIETLVNGEKPAGTYELTWHAENLPGGVYFYQLKTEKYTETKKMLLIK